MRALPVALVMMCLACGGRPRGGAIGLDRHAGPDASGEQVGAISADEAEQRLGPALEAGDARALVYASRAAAAGRVLPLEVQARLLELIDRLPGQALEGIWAELEPEVEPAPMVALRLALLARHRADDETALRWAGRVAAGSPVAGRAAELREEIESRRAVDGDRIAVLLPLSGPYEVLGREIRAAIEVAAAGAAATLVYVDTGGDEAGAVRAVDRAVYELHAAALLGPVGQDESRAAAARAVELGVPIALLAPGDDGAAPEAGVFRLWSSPEWEARMAAAAAIHLGYDRLAVLAPRDEQGAAQAAAFREAAIAAGAEVVTAGDYDPTATDLEPDIRAFLGLDPAGNERLRRHLRKRGKKGWKSFTPDIPFDLLYVPDRHDRAALVVAFLPYYNVELRSLDLTDPVYLRRKYRGTIPQVVQLLGSSAWHHPSLIPRGGSAIEGALVLDVWAGGTEEIYLSEEAAGFAEAFRRRAGHPPGAVAAQAHDAAALVLAAHASARGARDVRAAFIRALREARLSNGACGPATVSPAGEIEREPLILRVDGGEFVLHEY